MANTTNFGWETPDDTDLVKDGAAAIRTLGSAIDTSLVDLKGGTTGQVLSKTSNTDMDFTWVAQDDSNAIQNAIVDAKGDLISATAADTPARLAVGTNGQVLQADSTTATGLKWGTVSSGTWSQAATGSLTGSSITINTLSGKQYYVYLEGWSHSASSEYVQIRFNGDTGANYRRADSDSAVNELYLWGSGTVSGASTRSAGAWVNMADTSMSRKPFQSMTPLSTNGSVSGWYVSASAITSITIFTSGGSFDAGTYYVWSFA